MFNIQQVGKRIVMLRKKNNMTQTELADKMNVSFQAVSNWERGNSMPDISKLPELAEIFEVSVDDLIGEKSKLIDSVISNEFQHYLDNNELDQEELENHIPILKPDQVKTMVEHIDLAKLDDINSFLPFLDEETITFLAQKKIEKGESINSLLPFLEDEEIAKIAKLKNEKGESINSLLPFLEDEDIAEIAKKKIENGESINSLLPFLDEDFLKQIIKKYVK